MNNQPGEKLLKMWFDSYEEAVATEWETYAEEMDKWERQRQMEIEETSREMGKWQKNCQVGLLEFWPFGVHDKGPPPPPACLPHKLSTYSIAFIFYYFKF